MLTKKTTVLLLCWTHILSLWGNSSVEPPIRFQTAKSLSLANVTPSNGFTLFAPSLFLSERHIVRLSYQSHYLCSELQSFATESNFLFHRFRAAASFQTFGYSRYRFSDWGTSVATRVGNATSLGCSAHLQAFHYTGAEHTLFQPEFSFSISHNIRENSMLYANYILRQKSILSSGYSLSLTNTCWIIEGELLNWSSLTIKCAYEYLVNRFSIRLGAFGLPLTPTFGFGYLHKDWLINAGSQWNMHIYHHLSIDIIYHFHTKTQP